jgi:chromosome partitioning protein
LEEYRLIRPFVQNLRDNGYDSYLLETELFERNCYREIRSGYGTLQMLELTDTVKKARAEVKRLLEDVESLLAIVGKEAVNG